MTPVSPPRSSVIIRSLLLGGTLFGIFSAIRCTVEEETFVGPTDDSTKYLIFESLTSTRNRLFSQGDTCTVTLRIVDSSNEAKQGIDVRFSATLGTIASRDTTDSSGTASALYTSGDASGIEKITVRAGVKEDSLFLLIIDLASQVSAWSDTTNILADGESTVRIHAAVTDERGIELPGVDVYFSTNRGNITRSSVTDENGQTHAVLTSSPDTVDVEATVVASLEPSGGGLLRLPGELPSDPADGGPGPSQRAHRQASPSEITLHRDKFNLDTKRPSVEEPAGEPGQWQLADSLVITFEGITIDLRPDRAQLVANGEDETQITVTVLESSSGNPVADKSFRSTTTMGTIMGEGNTDGSGRGTLQLRSGTQPGTADITVTVGTGVSSTLQIPFISVHPTSLELSASSSSILADGESAATLTAQVIDTLGNPVAGATVEFGTDLGSLSALSVETDGKGEAQVAITSAANETDKTAQVTASVGGYPDLSGDIQILYRGVTIMSEAGDDLLVADGESQTQITTLLYETGAHVAVSNREVYLSTSSGTIESPSSTNSTGLASATLTAGTVPGTATVVASFGNVLRDTVSVVLVSPGPAALALSWDEESLLGDGESTALFVATVIDTFGSPVSGSSVTFSTTAGNLSKETVVTGAAGDASTVLTSSAGSADVTATLKAEVAGSSVPADSADVLFRGIHFMVSAVDSSLMANGVSSSQVKADLYETNTGNPLAGRTVFWSTTLGIIPASSLTDGMGQATTTLTAGVTSGTAVVTGSFGSALVNSDSVIFSPPGDSTLIMSWFNPEGHNEDGTDGLTISVLFADSLSNPVTGASIAFSLVPNTVGTIESPKTTDSGGIATTTLTYSSQFVGEIVQVKAESGSIKAFIDIILPDIN